MTSEDVKEKMRIEHDLLVFDMSMAKKYLEDTVF